MEKKVSGTIAAAELACNAITAKDGIREALKGIHVTEKYTEAADGAMFIRVNRQYLTDIAPGIYRHSARTVKGKNECFTFDNGLDILGVNGMLTVVDESIYPPASNVVNGVVNCERKNIMSIAIDAELLLKLAKTLNHSSFNPSTRGHVRLDLRLDEKDMPIAVQGKVEGSAGILMPLRHAETDFASPIETLKETTT